MDGVGRDQLEPTTEMAIKDVLYPLLNTEARSFSKVSRTTSRRVWEKIHRRKIPAKCCIHHRDLDPGNNNGENLLLIPVVLHLELHARLRETERTTCKLGFEVARYHLTQEYERRAAKLIAIWELLEDPPTE